MRNIKFTSTVWKMCFVPITVMTVPRARVMLSSMSRYLVLLPVRHFKLSCISLLDTDRILESIRLLQILLIVLIHKGDENAPVFPVSRSRTH